MECRLTRHRATIAMESGASKSIASILHLRFSSQFKSFRRTIIRGISYQLNGVRACAVPVVLNRIQDEWWPEMAKSIMNLPRSQ